MDDANRYVSAEILGIPTYKSPETESAIDFEGNAVTFFVCPKETSDFIAEDVDAEDLEGLIKSRANKHLIKKVSTNLLLH